MFQPGVGIGSAAFLFRPWRLLAFRPWRLSPSAFRFRFFRLGLFSPPAAFCLGFFSALGGFRPSQPLTAGGFLCGGCNQVGRLVAMLFPSGYASTAANYPMLCILALRLGGAMAPLAAPHFLQ